LSLVSRSTADENAARVAAGFVVAHVESSIFDVWKLLLEFNSGVLVFGHRELIAICVFSGTGDETEIVPSPGVYWSVEVRVIPASASINSSVKDNWIIDSAAAWFYDWATWLNHWTTWLFRTTWLYDRATWLFRTTWLYDRATWLFRT